MDYSQTENPLFAFPFIVTFYFSFALLYENFIWVHDTDLLPNIPLTSLFPVKPPIPTSPFPRFMAFVL